MHTVGYIFVIVVKPGMKCVIILSACGKDEPFLSLIQHYIYDCEYKGRLSYYVILYVICLVPKYVKSQKKKVKNNREKLNKKHVKMYAKCLFLFTVILCI